MYLQCTTIGPATDTASVSMVLQKSTKHQALSGMFLSGQAWKWNCLINWGLLEPRCKQNIKSFSNISLIRYFIQQMQVSDKRNLRDASKNNNINRPFRPYLYSNLIFYEKVILKDLVLHIQTFRASMVLIIKSW